MKNYYLIFLAMVIFLMMINSPLLFGQPVDLECDTDHAGIILLAGEQDTFLFSAQDSQLVRIRAHANAADFDLLLNIYGPDGNLFSSQLADAGGLAEFDELLFTPAGTYTIVISDVADNGKGLYWLSLQALNAPDCTTVAACDGAYVGGIFDATMEAYTLTLNEGGRLRLRTKFFKGADEFDGRIDVYDPAFNLVMTLSVDANGLIDLPLFVAPETGNWLFILYEQGGDETSTYGISFQLLTGADCAVTTECSGDHIGGVILPGEMKAYDIFLQTGDVVRLRAFFSSKKPFQGRIDVYAPDGNNVTTLYPNADGLLDLNTFTVPSTGNWLFVLYDEGGEDSSLYGFSFQLLNSLSGCAVPISCSSGGSTVNAYLFGEAEMDAYSFFAEAGDEFSGSFLGEEPTFHESIWLYAPDGSLVDSFLVTTDTDHAELKNVVLPQTGTYTVVLTETEGDNEPFDRYDFTFDLVPQSLAASLHQALPDTVVCAGSVVQYHIDLPNSTFSWDDGSNDPERLISTPGTYWVEVAFNGNCATRDSFMVSFVAPDTVSMTVHTCNPDSVGIFTYVQTAVNGCESVVVQTRELVAADTTLIFDTSCNPAQAGFFVNTFASDSGCDSVAITTIDLVLLDTTFSFSTSCDATKAGVFNRTFSTAEGCDSVVIETIDLLPRDTSEQFGTTCDPDSARTFIRVLSTSAGCDSVVKVSLTYSPFSMAIDGVPPSCFDADNGTLTVTAQGGTAPYVFALNGGVFQPGNQFDQLAGGTYTVVGQDANGCESDTTFFLQTPQSLQVTFPEPSLTIKAGDSLVLMPQFNIIVDSFFWTPSLLPACANCLAPIVSPLETTTWTLTVFDTLGCKASAAIEVIVEENEDFFVPNVFSPNQDGVNDYFTIFGSDQVSAVKSLRIFNRWGALVFERLDLPADGSEGWDGRFNGFPVNSGVFVWLAEVEFVNGGSSILKGEVVLLR